MSDGEYSTERGVLRIYGEGGVAVSLIGEYLAAVENAYIGISVFDRWIDRLARGGPWFWWEWERHMDSFSEGRRPSLLLSNERLVLSAVELGSPGFWEFLGTLNPLEVLRKALQDRHERRKDREYREAREDERLALENELLRTNLLERQIGLARQLGATDADLAPLRNRLVLQPLDALYRFQDLGVIDGAEIRQLPSAGHGTP